MRKLLACIVLASAMSVSATAAAAETTGTGAPLPSFASIGGVPALSSAASYVAGHPVYVDCVLSPALWSSMIGAGGPDAAWGFTDVGSTVIHIGPMPCAALLELADGDDVGTVVAAQGLLTLAHESEHQLGLSDESQAECAALPLVRDIAVKFFGIPATTTRTVTASKVISVKVGKRSKRVRVTYAHTVTEPNPYLARLAADATRWHNTLPESYRNC